MRHAKLLLLLTVCCLAACRNNTVYLHFHLLPQDGWDKDSVLTYSFTADTSQTYDILLHIRHTDAYPYQNMWLFLNDKHDTIEFYMADSHGRWLSRRGNGHRTMSVLFEHQYRFPTDSCTLTIQHGMRQDRLKGINAIGVEISKTQEDGKE